MTFRPNEIYWTLKTITLKNITLAVKIAAIKNTTYARAVFFNLRLQLPEFPRVQSPHILKLLRFRSTALKVSKLQYIYVNLWFGCIWNTVGSSGCLISKQIIVSNQNARRVGLSSVNAVLGEIIVKGRSVKEVRKNPFFLSDSTKALGCLLNDW